MNDNAAAVILYAEFTALPGRRSDVASLIGRFRDRVRQEPGNLAFAVSTRQTNADAFFVYEEYRDADAFAAHLRADYGVRFNHALSSLIVESGSTLTRLDPA